MVWICILLQARISISSTSLQSRYRLMGQTNHLRGSRERCRKILSRLMIKQRSPVPIPQTEEEEEEDDHFFSCKYSQRIWEEFVNMLGNWIEIHHAPILLTFQDNERIFPKRTHCWVLHWLLLHIQKKKIDT